MIAAAIIVACLLIGTVITLALRLSGVTIERDRYGDVIDALRADLEKTTRRSKATEALLHIELDKMADRLAACGDPQTIRGWFDDMLRSGHG